MLNWSVEPCERHPRCACPIGHGAPGCRFLGEEPFLVSGQAHGPRWLAHELASGHISISASQAVLAAQPSTAPDAASVVASADAAAFPTPMEEDATAAAALKRDRSSRGSPALSPHGPPTGKAKTYQSLAQPQPNFNGAGPSGADEEAARAAREVAARQEAALATAVGCANRGGRAAAEALEASAVQGEEAAAQREAAGAALATVIGVVMRGGTAAADALEAAALLSQTRLAFAAAASMRERSLFDRGLTLLRVDGSRAADALEEAAGQSEAVVQRGAAHGAALQVALQTSLGGAARGGLAVAVTLEAVAAREEALAARHAMAMRAAAEQAGVAAARQETALQEAALLAALSRVALGGHRAAEALAAASAQAEARRAHQWQAETLRRRHMAILLGRFEAARRLGSAVADHTAELRATLPSRLPTTCR